MQNDLALPEGMTDIGLIEATNIDGGVLPWALVVAVVGGIMAVEKISEYVGGAFLDGWHAFGKAHP